MKMIINPVSPNAKTLAQQTIDKLRQVYNGNRFQFDFSVSQLIAGDHNKQLRKEIVKTITGEDRPLTKCGMHSVADVLKNNFDQLNLFQ